MSFFHDTLKRIPLFLLALAVTFMCAAGAELEIHFLDVGQGDSTLLICDGEAMLIDGGLSLASRFVFSYLKEHVDELIYVIATHPDSDHIGGLSAAFNAVPVEILYTTSLQFVSFEPDCRLFGIMYYWSFLHTSL